MVLAESAAMESTLPVPTVAMWGIVSMARAAVVLALGHACGKQPCGRTVSHAEAVGNEQYDVFGHGFGCGIDLPGDARGFCIPSTGFHRIRASRKACPAQDESRAFAILIGHELGLFAQYLGGIAPIDGQPRGIGVGQPGGKFHLDVKTAAGKDFGLIQRIDGRGLRGGWEQDQS